MFSEKIKIPEHLKKVKKNSFQLHFKSQSVRNYIQREHPTNTVQIETLDDEISSYTLYKMAQPPMDIAKFLILIDPDAGINLYKDSKETGFEITVE